MHLYIGTSTQFVNDATQNLIAQKIADSFFDAFRYKASIAVRRIPLTAHDV